MADDKPKANLSSLPAPEKSRLSESKQALLAKLMKGKRSAAADAAAGPASDFTIPSTGYLAGYLSDTQKRMWFLQGLEPEQGAYNMLLARRLDGVLDLEILERAFTEIVRRHAVLRTVFVEEAGEPRQQVLADMPLDFSLVDLTHVDAGLRDQEARRLLAQARARPFDLAREAPIRIQVLQLAQEHHVLAVVVHHIAADLWSFGIVLHELSALYRALSRGLPSPLAPLPIQYLDFAQWQHERLHSAEATRKLDYWKRQLHNAPLCIDLPTDRPRPAVQSFRGAFYTFSLPPALLQSLPGLARETSTTLFMLLSAAFNVLLYRLSGETDLCVGSAIANRNRPELENLIGFFANTIVLRNDLSGTPTFRDLLVRLRGTALDAYSNPDVPFEQLVKELAPQRNPGYSPLYQVFFVLQNIAMEALDLPGITATPLPLESSTAKHDLCFFMYEKPDELFGLVEYSTDLYDEQTIADIADLYARLLEAIVAAPDTPIDRLALLPPALHGDIDAEWAYLRRRERHAQIAGQAISLAAVEARLRRHPAIAECAVIQRPAQNGETALIAFAVLSSPCDEATLAAYGETCLPAAERPAAWVVLPNLSLKANGQVDVRRLSQLPVINQALARAWEQSIRQVPAVDDVAVLIEPAAAVLPPLHLGTLLPEWARFSDANLAGVLPQAPAATHDLPPALVSGPPLQPDPAAPQTLVAALIRTATDMPDQGILCIDAAGRERFLSYADLLHRARCVLTGLHALGMRQGDHVLLQINALDAFFPAYWGCLLGGIIPTNVAVPPVYSAQNEIVNKLKHAWQLLAHPWIIADAGLVSSLQQLAPAFGAEVRVAAADALRNHAPAAQLPELQPDDHAFYQLTSGSTGASKAVIETHAHVIHHVRAAAQANGYGAGDVSLNWLAMDHVVPLLMTHLKDVYLGCQQIHAVPAFILGEPLRWLDLIEQHRVTYSWAPNFAFRLVANALPGHPGRHWDLASMRHLVNAGEQVTYPVMQAFLAATERFGMRASALLPGFGMAETATVVCYQNRFSLDDAVHHFVQSPAGMLERVPADTPGALCLVDNGAPIAGVQMRIVDQNQAVLPECMIGKLQVGGGTVMPGYYRNPEANSATFAPDGWLDTGDLACMVDGRILITGRAKEVIIINGANLPCHDIEEAVSRVPGVLPTFVASCAVTDTASGSEGLVVFFVAESASAQPDLPLIQTIGGAVAGNLGVTPQYVIPVRQSEFPKTTSGKIQRGQLKSALLAGRFDATLQAIDLALGNAHTMPDWFYGITWRQKALPAGAGNELTGRYLAIGDAPELQRQLAGHTGQAHWVFASEHADDHDSLLQSAGPFDAVVYIAGQVPAADAASSPEGVDQVTRLTLLAQALARVHPDGRELLLLVASTCTQSVHAGDPIAPANAAVIGLLKTLPHEWPWLRCRHLDLARNDPLAARHILDELHVVREPEREVAYRAGTRWVPRLKKREFATPRPLPFKQGGTYLISGGMGGLGVHLAQYLLTAFHANVLLVGRTALDGGSKEAQRRVALLQDLERLPGRVAYVAADVACREQVASAVSSLAGRGWPVLDGVLHLAGLFDETPVAQETPAHLAHILAAKTQGAWNLHEALRAINAQGLFIGFSSAHTCLGAYGIGGYTAANRYLEALCAASPLDAYCLAWSLIDDTGMAHGYRFKHLVEARGLHAVAPEQALPALRAALHQGARYTLIGLDDSKPAIRQVCDVHGGEAPVLHAYYAQRPGETAQSVLQALVVRDACGESVDCTRQKLERLPRLPSGDIDPVALSRMRHHRTASRQAFEAPRNPVEQALADIWTKLLRVQDISIHDSFFDLGGHSLLATQMASRVRQKLNIDVTVAAIFQKPTIAALSPLFENDTLQHPQLIRLRSAPQGTPLFCFHAAGGDVLTYLDLTAELDGRLPVFALQPPSLAIEDHHATLTAMAEEYASIIRSQQVSGPYRLLGWSMGGLLAHQVAALLENSGEHVEFLGLIDAAPPATDSQISNVTAWTGLMSMFGAAFLELDHATQEHLVSLLNQAPRPIAVRQTLDWMQSHDLSPAQEPTPESVLAQLQLTENHCRLMQQHRPSCVAAPLTVWWANQTLRTNDQYPLDWRHHTENPDTTVSIIEGRHFSITRAPRNQQIAKWLSEKFSG